MAAPAPEHGFTGPTIQRNRYSVFQKQPGGHHRLQFYTSISSPATAPGQGSALRLGPHPPPIPPSPQGADKVPFRLLSPPFPSRVVRLSGHPNRGLIWVPISAKGADGPRLWSDVLCLWRILKDLKDHRRLRGIFFLFCFWIVSLASVRP